MADAIRPRDLPAATTIPADSAIVLDNGVTVAKATPDQIATAARPYASQAQAEMGADNSTTMTPLRVKQALAPASAASAIGSSEGTVQDSLNARARKANPVFEGSSFYFPTPQSITAVLNGKESKASITSGADATEIIGNMLAEMPTNGKIDLPACPVGILSSLTRTGGIAMRGHGSGSSRIHLNNNATLQIDGGAVSFPNNQASLQDIMFVTDDTMHAGPMLSIDYSGRDFASGAFRTLYMRNVQMRGSAGDKVFMTGLHLTNCTNMLLDGVKVTGRGDRPTGSKGFIIDGDEQPIDMYLVNCGASFFDTCVNAIAGGPGLGMEGLFLDNFLGIFSNYGLAVNFETVHDVVSVTNSNFNCYKKNLTFNNVHNIHVAGSTLYNAAATPAEATFLAIEIYNDDPAFTFSSNNVISHNRGFGATATAPSQTFLSINSVNGASNDTLVDANNVTDFEFPVALFSGAKKCRITDTNNFNNYTTRITDLGVNNLVQAMPVTIAKLPAATAWPSGARAIVTDALTPSFVASLTPGGAQTTPVFSDGAIWRAG